MSDETRKSWGYRNHRGDFQKYLHGRGIDIGCGPDLLKTHAQEVRGWDLEDGDGTYMAGVADNSFDFVYSSHCLEHLTSVPIGLTNWMRICKPYGHVYVVVPDFELYEKRRWPSSYNGDHKSSFSLHLTREEVGRDNHFHIWHDIMPIIADKGRIVEVRLEDENYNYTLPDSIDQTLANAQCQICVVIQKTCLG
jgi:ubiquinone/menaquinone biosynthesis C-methylase UbiE